MNKRPSIWNELRIVLTCPFRWPHFPGRQNREYCWKSMWDNRVSRWKTHIDAQILLKHQHLAACPFTDPLSAYYAEQIDYLANHLSIIDTKVSMLLTFLGLISITSFLSTIQPGGTDGHLLRTSLTIALYAAWLIATLLCLWAVYQVIWGELSSKDPKTVLEDIDELIKTVIERTAKYRVAVLLTFIAVLSAAGFMAIIWWS